MTEKIELVTTQVVAKPRKLSAKWTVETHGKHEKLSKEELQDKIVETYDRWNWDTGSDEDKNLLDELEEERETRLDSIMFGLDVEEELAKAISEEIKGEIDDEILAILCGKKK